MDQFSAPVLLHEEAVYLHEGAQFHVERLDWEEKKAYVHPVDVDYYTDALASVAVQVLDTFAGPDGDAIARSHGEVKITSLASMFKKIRFHTHENIGSGPIHLPEQTLHTTGYWITVDDQLWTALGRETLDYPTKSGDFAGTPGMEAGLQGMAHSLRHVASIRLMCDPRDLGAVAEVRSATTRLPTVTVYEIYPGGVGYSQRMYELHLELLEQAAALVSDCACLAGCPSCIGPLHLVEGAKSACLRLLSATSESVLIV
jgi:DEAD/DEAH box helicase domain-containing protein